MSRNVLYALPVEETRAHMKLLFQQSPIQLLEIPALFITASPELIEADEEAVYSAVPLGFDLVKNPFTQNTSLVITLEDWSPSLIQRIAVGDGELNPCIFISDMVHAIPRNYRAYLNSLEEAFNREGFTYEFHSEFIINQ